MVELDPDKGWLDVKESVEEVGKLVGLKEPKTDASKRRIELDADVVAILRQHRARQREDAFQCGGGYDRASDLVCAQPDGTLWRPSNFTTRFLKFARALGVDHSYHDMRHFHATALLDAGVDPVVVSHRLGHTDVKFTITRYCHVLTDSGRRAADTFGR